MNKPFKFSYFTKSFTKKELYLLTYNYLGTEFNKLERLLNYLYGQFKSWITDSNPLDFEPVVVSSNQLNSVLDHITIKPIWFLLRSSRQYIKGFHGIRNWKGKLIRNKSLWRVCLWLSLTSTCIAGWRKINEISNFTKKET